MGFYTDPYSDFGRLGMELWRACRLVVDTGLHHKRWSREKAIAYLTENTPNPDSDIRKAIERYIVYPGQATAYMIGKLKILELRERAQKELGAKFTMGDFHDVILKSGPVPLNVMEERVDAGLQARNSIYDGVMTINVKYRCKMCRFCPIKNRVLSAHLEDATRRALTGNFCLFTSSFP